MKSRMASFCYLSISTLSSTVCLSSTEIFTYLVGEFAHTALPGSAKVAGHDTLDADVLCGADEVLLRQDGPRDDCTDDNLDPSKGVRQLRDAVSEVPNSDVDTGRAERLRRRLGLRGGAYQCCDVL